MNSKGFHTIAIRDRTSEKVLKSKKTFSILFDVEHWNSESIPFGWPKTLCPCFIWNALKYTCHYLINCVQIFADENNTMETCIPHRYASNIRPATHSPCCAPHREKKMLHSLCSLWVLFSSIFFVDLKKNVWNENKTTKKLFMWTVSVERNRWKKTDSQNDELHIKLFEMIRCEFFRCGYVRLVVLSSFFSFNVMGNKTEIIFYFFCI